MIGNGSELSPSSEGFFFLIFPSSFYIYLFSPFRTSFRAGLCLTHLGVLVPSPVPLHREGVHSAC